MIRKKLRENGEEREKMIANKMHVARKLFELSKLYEDIAYGKIKPHTDQMNTVSVKAHSVVRYLIADYV